MYFKYVVNIKYGNCYCVCNFRTQLQSSKIIENRHLQFQSIIGALDCTQKTEPKSVSSHFILTFTKFEQLLM